MYIPKYYQVNDFNEIKSFIRENSFAAIVSYDGVKPIATHVPVNIQETEGDLYVSGHFAKGNQQWKTMDDKQNALVMFQGPHGYVSSTWYKEENVPTWNYQSVHIYGTSEILSEEELIEDLTSLLNSYEGHREKGATWDNLSETTRQQVKGIVGFRVKVDEVQAAYKLSQNRNEEDYENIIKELRSSKNRMENELADAMNTFLPEL
ncbi:FMN-binding negative transcriptional regulator [Salinicoccus hispanicus]|uniref:FMN-binding negative transcriptional regulator n=1 Tax=Salinicoccus hispanicus TaxID=157225 RepID=A0A6N8U8N8_9STAP|nr:FMN-binding negative transcriptional regulator [Salinicoccus hispanicus]MXQ52039.1 FMN-binding negative transcriptional regulator [Salinicoccus hispanicus]